MKTRPTSSAIALTTFTRTTLAVLLIAAMGAAAACGDDSPDNPTSPTTLPRAEYSQTDLLVGTGTEATNGKRLSVHYTLWMYDPAGSNGKGQQIQTSVGGTPFPFVLGTGAVIAGWDRGVPGMLIGGRRRLVLPPELAYGAAGNPPIPGNASLVFEIELLSVQ
jgi:FKBP-type peptidyl-prolyl cis-trans isomerase FkpA